MPHLIPHLVSTIIPAYNRPQMLKRAVESVLKQTYRPIEAIISDDGSTDGTPEMGRTLEKTHPDEVRYIWNPNRGAGPARESGRQLAQGEFIQYLDSDDRLLPPKFEVMVKALREHPECGAAYGFIRFCPEGQEPWPQPYKCSGQELPELFPRLLYDRWWNTDCPLFRRTVCDAVGPWTDLRYSQDWEYDGRVGALKTKLIHCPEFVCEQHDHGGVRQTAKSPWLKPPDRLRFLRLMFQHGRQAGVGMESPEMRHFARWSFLNARQCGLLGDAAAAKGCLELAVEASNGAFKDMPVYRVVANTVGWRIAAQLASALDRLKPGKTSNTTLKQSWMERPQTPPKNKF
ncbi:MAG: glycosyltransferase family A protein [Verrucomicrobiota bacterium]